MSSASFILCPLTLLSAISGNGLDGLAGHHVVCALEGIKYVPARALSVQLELLREQDGLLRGQTPDTRQTARQRRHTDIRQIRSPALKSGITRNCSC